LSWRHVINAKAALINKETRHLKLNIDAQVHDGTCGIDRRSQTVGLAATVRLLPLLIKIDRYEKRAWNCLRRAIHRHAVTEDHVGHYPGGPP
jgi:hypothetical protein